MRSSKAFWFLMTILIITGGFIVICWDDVSRQANTVSSRPRLGRELFMILSFIQMCCLGMISPILTATAISGERERRTLDMLRITGIKSGSIIWGKLGSALAYQALLVVCMLPITTLIFMMGGVGLNEFVFWTFMILQVVVVYGMFGLAVSSVCRKSTDAMVVTVLVLAMFSVGIPMLRTFLIELNLIGMLSVSKFIIIMTSPVIIWIIAENVMWNSGVFPSSAYLLLFSHLIFQALLFVGSFFVARWGLERRENIQVRQAKKIIDDTQVLEKRRNRFPYYMIDPLRRALPIGDRQNPVFIKEKRVGALASSTALIRTCYITVFFSLFASFFLLDLDLKELQMTLSLGAFGLTVICLPILAGGIVSREREESTLDLLLCTPMSPFQIVWAKYLAVIRFVLPVALSALPLPVLFYLLLSPISSNNYTLYGSWIMYAMAVLGMGGRVILFLMASLSLYTSVPIYYSSKHRKSIMAILMSIVVISALVVGPSIMSAMLEALSYVLNEMRVDSSLQLQNTMWDPWLLIRIMDWMQKMIVNLGPVISPYYEFVTTGEMHHENPDLIGKIFTWSWTIFQAVALAGMTLAVLRLAGRRLRKSVQ